MRRAEATVARGDPDCPLTGPELTEKFRRFAQPVLGDARSDRIEAAVAAISNPGPARVLIEEVLSPA